MVLISLTIDESIKVDDSVNDSVNVDDSVTVDEQKKEYYIEPILVKSKKVKEPPASALRKQLDEAKKKLEVFDLKKELAEANSKLAELEEAV